MPEFEGAFELGHYVPNTGMGAVLSPSIEDILFEPGVTNSPPT
jgi:hypothetical protein